MKVGQKMWANSNREAKSIINAAQASGFNLLGPEEMYLFRGGFYLYKHGVTFSSRDDRQYFDRHNFEEFHFATPVELSEKDSSISDECVKVAEEQSIQKPHSHYFKSVQHLDYIDVYRVLDLFNVTDPCLQHSIKKLLVAGGRGAGKNIAQDVQEAIDSLERWKQMRAEDSENQ